MTAPMKTKFTRRQTFQSALGASVLFALAEAVAGCTDSEPDLVATPQQIEKTVHLTLSLERLSLLKGIDFVELHVGAARFKGEFARHFATGAVF